MVAETLQTIVTKAAAGHTAADLDRIAAEILATHDASSPFLNYHPRGASKPFPAVNTLWPSPPTVPEF
ncbi:hypothetical protein A5740_23580 [Mycobacterium sp. GA-1841]|nr:hypothetical protein A5740_23580 [Mycobacterium sp. GA-1841]